MKKIIAVLLTVSMAALALTGCGSKGSKSNEITFGTNAEFPPFEYVTSSGTIGEYDGIDIAILKAIGEDTGKEIKIENMEFDSLLIALQNGQIDAVISGMTITEERSKSVDFSHPYYEATQVMIVDQNSDIKTAADMEGKKIVVIQGYTGELCVQDLGFEYEAFKKGTEAILELNNGKCDVVVLDSATAQKYVKDNPNLKIVEDRDSFEVEEYGIAVKKGNTELLNAINASIDKMLSDGRIAEWSVSYSEQ
ncbi:MAG: basic amino acid ABC transporter substrate-binding protein [Lachnospiraceae bacterium]|nr:basic amino acid ABC transporter substrate-binding protein [Lachnospiraceae bacterium]MBR5765827.1 basic amino acid ABC transporter substrate-binding protein [Lachnospiraceae bacterium]MBR6469636.1 basic amino acid ABC transporter substrate-binding protein [Lachnospiraceae bacterium]MBR6486233.1 basic amino acid ABC transporter substrate-binding protein [Lachnospiraceae bacterium]